MVKLRISVCLIASLIVSACSIHHPDIQQGNVLETDKVEKLEVGMDKNQVRFLLGSPLIQDPFHADRWDYIYSYEIVRQQVERGRVSIYFDGDKISRIEKIPLQASKQKD